MTKRTRYSQEFKREAVAMASQPGVTCRQVALEIGVNPNLLSRWKRELEEVPAKAFKGSGTPRDEELARLNGSRRNVIFCAKRQRSSQRGRPEVSGDSTLSRRFPCSPYVPMPQGIAQWLL